MSTNSAPISKAQLWTGRVMGWVPAIMMLAGGIMNITKPASVVESTVAMGFSESIIVPTGIALAVSALLYLIPRTAVLGAILLTGYFGGAVAIHVTKGDGPIQILIPIIFGILFWGGLFLTDRRVSDLIPLRK